MKLRILLFLIGALLLIPPGATPMTPIRCIIPIVSLPERIASELNSATAVFSGNVIAAEYRPVKNPREHLVGTTELVIKIAVHRWWKGDGRDEMEMHTTVTKTPDGMISSYAEDFNFEVGKEYLVYAFGEADSLHTDSCRLTRKLELAEEQLRILGEGEKPKKVQ